MSHLGRPKGISCEEGKEEAGPATSASASAVEGQEEFSLRQVAQRLEEIMRAEQPDSLPVLFAEDCLNANEFIRRSTASWTNPAFGKCQVLHE